MKFLPKVRRGAGPVRRARRELDWHDPEVERDRASFDPEPAFEAHEDLAMADPPLADPEAANADMSALDLIDLEMENLQVPEPAPIVPGRKPVRQPRQRPAGDEAAETPSRPRPPARHRSQRPDRPQTAPNQTPNHDQTKDNPARAGEGWLTASNLRRTYSGKPVVQDVSIAVRRGESVGLLGPNGAGKTTLFYMITGLIRADSGAITLDGNDVTRLPMYRRARLGIGYLPQESSIFRGLNVEDNIRAVLQVVEPDRKKRRRELDALLEEFGIAHLRKSPSISLSGGERRRCEIARALASRPSFMLLDEPFAGIDPIAVGDIQALVRHLTARGIGILITDHNVRETLGLVDRAYIVHTGQVLTEGTPDEIVENPDVRRFYLGDQFTL